MRVQSVLAGFALAITLTILPTSTQARADDYVGELINYALRKVPGGIQTARNEVTWADGTMLVLADAEQKSSAAALTCPSGKFCAHSDTYGAGSRLEFSSCPSSNSVTALPKVRSVSNARASGTVTGRNGSTTVVTASPGVVKNVTKTITSLVCA